MNLKKILKSFTHKMHLSLSCFSNKKYVFPNFAETSRLLLIHQFDQKTAQTGWRVRHFDLPRE